MSKMDELDKLWVGLPILQPIVTTDEFTVFVASDLGVEWQTTEKWKKDNPKDQKRHSAIVSRAASLEAAPWEGFDQNKTLTLRRLIGEAVARCLEGDYANAQKTLDAAGEYRATMITNSKRNEAISQHVQTKDGWRNTFRRWNIVHYMLGIAAIFCSSLVAAKPAWFGFQEFQNSFYEWLAWLVALLTGLLTFLSPDRKAQRYQRAWSILNSQITRYNADNTYTLNDVLEAYQQGENIISETESDVAKPTPAAALRPPPAPAE